MSKLLEQAFSEAEKLPEPEQEKLGAWLLEELRAERSWERMLNESADALEKIADEALKEHRTGRTKDLDPDRL